MSCFGQWLQNFPQKNRVYSNKPGCCILQQLSRIVLTAIYFIMDPVVTGGNYDITALLGKMYTPEKAAEYNKLFDESLARKQTHYTVVQSRH